MAEVTRPTTEEGRPDPLTGDSAEMELYRAVRRYVESLEGSIVVIGGIEIQEWPDDANLTYRVAVRCTGRAPRKQP